MVRTSKSPRSLRSSLRSPFSSLKDEQATPRKPVVAKAPPHSPFRLTPKKAIRKLRLPGFSQYDGPENESGLNDTYCSEDSEDTSVMCVEVQEQVAEEDLEKDPLEITQAHCPTRVPATPGPSLSLFLEKDRDSGPQRPTRLASITPSQISATTIRGPNELAELPLMPYLDISIAETLFREVSNTLPKVSMSMPRLRGPVFAQLRLSEGKAHVDYVRLPLIGHDGSDSVLAMEATSPVPKLTRSPPFVGLALPFHNGVLNKAA